LPCSFPIRNPIGWTSPSRARAVELDQFLQGEAGTAEGDGESLAILKHDPRLFEARGKTAGGEAIKYLDGRDVEGESQGIGGGDLPPEAVVEILRPVAGIGDRLIGNQGVGVDQMEALGQPIDEWFQGRAG